MAPEDDERLSLTGAVVHLELLSPPALTRTPSCRRGPDGSLTIAVEELEPVVNPVIGLLAVGFLGCIRTQGHKRRRRGRRERVDRLRGNNCPQPGPRPGSRTGSGAAEIAANCDPSAAPPTRPSLLPLPFQKIPWGAHRRSLSLGVSGLGPHRPEPRVVTQSRAGSPRAPLTLECEAGLASLQLWGALRELFWSRTSWPRSPGSPRTGSDGGPRAGMC